MRRAWLPCFLLLVLLLPLPARADGGLREYVFVPEDADSAGDAWDAVLDALPDEAAEELGGLDPADPEAAMRELREKTGFTWLWEKLIAAVERSAGTVFPSAAPVFASLLLMAAVRSAVPGEAMADAFARIVRLGQAVLVFGIAADSVTLAQNALSLLCRVMELMIPVMEGVSLLGWALTQTQVTSAGILFAVTLVNEVSARILVPVTGLLLGLTAVSSGCGILGGLAGGVKKFLLRLWQIVSLAVSFMLGAQSTLARSADSLGARGAKFALSSFIPVAGSALAEAFQTVRAGVTFLRGAAGIGGMLALLLLLLPVIVPLALTKLMFFLGQQAAEILELKDAGTMLAGAVGIMELLIAFVLYSFMMFFFALVLFTGARGSV